METLAVEEAFIGDLTESYGYTKEEAKLQWLMWGDYIINGMWDSYSNSISHYIDNRSGEEDDTECITAIAQRILKEL